MELENGFIIRNKVLYYYGEYDKTVVEIPEGVEIIAMAAFFAHKEILEIRIPDSVTYIGKFAFAECSAIKEININKNITFISDDAFDSCDELERIEVDKQNSYFKSVDGVVYSNDLSKILRVPSNYKKDNFVIPNTVVEIATNAFNRVKHVNKIILTSNITKIGYKSFCYCNGLKEVSLPESIREIGYCAFANCQNLENINVPVSNQFYVSKDGVLYDVKMERLLQYPSGRKGSIFKIPKSVESLEDRALTNNNNLECIEGNKFFTSIDGVLFDKNEKLLLAYPAGKKDKEYKIPNSVIEICGSAFQGVKYLQKVCFGKCLKKISRHAFENASIKDVFANEGLENVGWFSFSRCKNIEKIDFSMTNLNFINGGAFSFCSNLQEILLPSSVNEIIRWTFLECKKLKKICYLGDINQMFCDGAKFFITTDELDKIY